MIEGTPVLILPRFLLVRRLRRKTCVQNLQLIWEQCIYTLGRQRQIQLSPVPSQHHSPHPVLHKEESARPTISLPRRPAFLPPFLFPSSSICFAAWCPPPPPSASGGGRRLRRTAPSPPRRRAAATAKVM